MQEEMTRLRMAAAGEDGMLITGEARRTPPGFCRRAMPPVRNRAVRCSPPIWAEALSPWACPMAQADLLPGEIRLTARCCHTAALSDGRVYLNGVEITPAGTAEKGGQSHGSDAS